MNFLVGYTDADGNAEVRLARNTRELRLVKAGAESIKKPRTKVTVRRISKEIFPDVEMGRIGPLLGVVTELDEAGPGSDWLVALENLLTMARRL